MWVVIYHFSPPATDGTPRILKNFTHLGFTGVGFFFVLSGFVLAYIYAPRAGNFKASSFFLARFARIYPVYLLSFVLATIPVLLDRAYHHPFPSDLSVKIPAYLLMIQSWLPWYGQELNGTGWTLSVEVLFYALFPLLLPLVVKMNRRAVLIGLLLSALVALIVPTLAVATGVTSSSVGFVGNFFRYFPLVHAPAFFFGAFLARLYEEDRKEGRYAHWALPVGLVALSLVIVFNRVWLYYYLHDGGLLIPFGLIIYGLAAREGIGGHDKVPNWLILLGDASYGIYILQLPIHAWINAVLARLPASTNLDNTPGLVAYACLLSAICVLIYRYFELPAREALRGRGRRSGSSVRP